MWVYSGRRGIHCWISDIAALQLTDEQRKSIVGYIEVIKGSAQQHKKVDLHRPLHPSIRTTLDTELLKGFERIILEDQDCFRKESGWEAMLNLLPVNEERLVKVRQDLENKWRNGPEMSSKERWLQLVAAGSTAVGEETNALKVMVLLLAFLRYTSNALARFLKSFTSVKLSNPNSQMQWKTSSYNTCIRASMPKYRSTRTIF